MSSEPSATIPKGRLEQAAGVLVFAAAFLFFGWLYTRFPVLYDTDSYYHLAAARAYDAAGLIDELPWARFSLLADGFGDKELLFHLLLVPFVDGEGPPSSLGGRWALAFLNALLAGAVTYFGVRAVGLWGLLLPFFVWTGSEDFFGRVIRLRPELLSLLLILAAIACAGRGRARLLGLVMALYTLSYTAFHALLGLCLVWFVVRGWTEKRWDPKLVLYPVLGTGAGLLLHPHFPHNLLIWKVQSVDFFARKAELNVGTEIAPATTDELLWHNLAWVLGLLALAFSSSSPSGKEDKELRADDASMAWAFHVATGAFGVLFLLMQRFSIYFIPLASLSLAWELRRRALVPGWTLRFGGRQLPVVLVLAAAAVLGLWRTGPLAVNLARAGDDKPLAREDEWAAFGQAVPAGARVAAEWGSAHLYTFWAPQAFYLNVLDPIFMATPYPAAYAAARAVFEGREPDIPYVLEAELASSFLAISTFHPELDLSRRLARDPRVRIRHQAYTSLYELVPGANGDFVLDWRVMPYEGRPPMAAEATDGFAVYPRAERGEERALEGFVDADRVDGSQEKDCVTFVRDEEIEADEERLYELSSWGPATFWLDAQPVVTAATGSRAFLDGGLAVPLRLTAGRRRWAVTTCRDGEERRAGFYLRRLPVPPS